MKAGQHRITAWPLGLSGVLALTLVTAVGCGRKSSLLLERQARGPLEVEGGIASEIQWILEPATQQTSQDGLDVTVTHMPPASLQDFFSRQEIFGPYAGMNPFFNEQIVFYVKITNHSGRKIQINPDDFVMLDDQGNQYSVLSPDYTTALAEAKAPVSTTTRGVLADARPGYFGFSLPMGSFIGKPQRRFALLSMSNLRSGYLYGGAVYDGFIAFWSPHRNSAGLKLWLSNIKTDFDAKDWPQRSLELTFEFMATRHNAHN